MTGLFELYLVAVAISLDTFAASLALGTRTPPRGWLRIAIVFALSGGALPVIGMGIGQLASGVLAQVAGGLGALVLAGLGGWFLHGAFKGESGRPEGPGAANGSSEGPGDQAGTNAPAADLPGPTPVPGHLAGIARELPLGGLVLLALGLSSDNLLVGIGIGLQGGTTLLLGLMTTASVFGATLTGLWLGRQKRLWFGRLAEGLAGLLLLALSAWFLAAWITTLRNGAG